MKPEEFIARIIQEYQNARASRFVDEKIRRGRSHSVSSTAEDLFAYFLVSNDPTIEKVYVDQPITLKNSHRTIYPDIVVIKGGKISSMFDLKMDLGWKRKGLVALCEAHAKTAYDVREDTGQLKDGQEKTAQTYEASADATYNVVIISGKNITAEGLSAQLGEVEEKRLPVGVFVLCKEMHPNRYGFTAEELMGKLDRETLTAVCDSILALV